MKIYVGQVYVEPEVKFCLSHHFQILMGEKLTGCAFPSDEFIEKYGDDFNVMFRLSAKLGLIEPEIKGPVVFRKDRDIEFSIFLPHNGIFAKDKESHRSPLIGFLRGIVATLAELKIDTSKVEQISDELVGEIILDRDGKMFRF